MPCAEKSESRILGDVNVLEGLLLSMSMHVDVVAAELWLLRAAAGGCELNYELLPWLIIALLIPLLLVLPLCCHYTAVCCFQAHPSSRLTVREDCEWDLVGSGIVLIMALLCHVQ